MGLDARQGWFSSVLPFRHLLQFARHLSLHGLLVTLYLDTVMRERLPKGCHMPLVGFRPAESAMLIWAVRLARQPWRFHQLGGCIKTLIIHALLFLTSIWRQISAVTPPECRPLTIPPSGQA